MPVLTLGEGGLNGASLRLPSKTGGQKDCLLTCSCLLILGIFFFVGIEHKAWLSTDTLSPFIFSEWILLSCPG